VDLSAYADKIEAQLKNNCFGYAFVVSKLGQPSVSRAFGWARQSPPDSNGLPMSVSVKFPTASVSKNITATAFLKLLNETQELSLDESLNGKIVNYLPFNWTPGAGVDTITFRELLRHRAGLRCDDFVDYQNLKKCLAQPLDVSKKLVGCNDEAIADNQIGCYRNQNYALFRIIIPVMLGKIVKPTQAGLSEDEIDNNNAALAADVYIKYVNENVFAKAGLPTMFCDPTDGGNQGLAYKYAVPVGNGTDFGPSKLTCGSEGWFLSATDLAKYFQALNEGYKIAPAVIPARMRSELLGYDSVSQFDLKDGKITLWAKSGGYPAAQNAGEINTLLLKFSNNVELAIIINSDLANGVNYGSVVTNSMSDLLNGK